MIIEALKKGLYLSVSKNGCLTKSQSRSSNQINFVTNWFTCNILKQTELHKNIFKDIRFLYHNNSNP